MVDLKILSNCFVINYGHEFETNSPQIVAKPDDDMTLLEQESINQSCNKDLRRFRRFLDSPTPQGKILPIETKYLMHVNALDLWLLQISLLICNL